MKSYRLICLMLAFVMLACTKEPDDPANVDTSNLSEYAAVNTWMYNVMQLHYLWSATLPSINNTYLQDAPTTYFNDYIRYRYNTSVAYVDDTYGDRFSYVNGSVYTRSQSISQEYAAAEVLTDFGFRYYSFKDYLLVLYVVPDSPADAAGLKRGDCFNVASGSQLNATSMGTVKLEVFYPKKREVVLTRETYVNNPILRYEMLAAAPKTAYLVYNHFTSGTSDIFNENLREVFTYFNNAGTENLILDLRYNGGGELSVARLLASFIAPRKVLGSTFIYLERNSSFGMPGKFEEQKFHTASEVNGSNSDIKNLYILTSANTASASELIIHGFQAIPDINVTVIGDVTVGKNLGSVTITHAKFPGWSLSPITIRIYDRALESDYENGIRPDYPAYDAFNINFDSSTIPVLLTVADFGDYQNDPLLRRAVSLISGSDLSSSQHTRLSSELSEPLPGLDIPQYGIVEEPVHITE